jgi:tetratricopeptide (TPR) repeat protein
MNSSLSQTLCATLRFSAAVAFAVVGCTGAVTAQTSPPAGRDPKPPVLSTPQEKPPAAPERKESPPAQADKVEAPAKRPQLGKVVPDSPGERAKLLSDLYAHLATAPDEEAAKPFVEAIERVWLSPGSDTISALIERSLKAVNQQRPDLALQLLTAVVELAPDYAEGWNRRAYVFFTEGDYERSLGDLRRVLALDPNHYKAIDGIGQIMRQLDRKSQALTAYEKLMSIHPSWPNIQSTVDELRRDVEGRPL